MSFLCIYLIHSGLISTIRITHDEDGEEEDPYEESRYGNASSTDDIFLNSEPGDKEPVISVEDTDGYVNPFKVRVQRSLPGSFYVRRMTVLQDRRSCFENSSDTAGNFMSKIRHQMNASSELLTEDDHEEELPLARSRNLMVGQAPQIRKVIFIM